MDILWSGSPFLQKYCGQETIGAEKQRIKRWADNPPAGLFRDCSEGSRQVQLQWKFPPWFSVYGEFTVKPQVLQVYWYSCSLWFYGHVSTWDLSFIWKRPKKTKTGNENSEQHCRAELLPLIQWYYPLVFALGEMAPCSGRLFKRLFTHSPALEGALRK